MPEGPSIVILRELVEALHLENQKVIDVTGTTTIDKERMLNKKVQHIKSWGKHFLICFDNFALRIHLMMFGSYRINERKDVPPKIRLTFKHGEINFYTCDLKFIEGNLGETYDWTADIMSEKFIPKNTAKKMEARQDEVLCDILLDQTIFAGSGNIIKNEVLYRVGLHPLTRVGSLTKAKLTKLAAEVKAYGSDFFVWKKANVFKRHWQIYGKKSCPKGHPVIRENLGQNKRITFHCAQCQPFTES